MADDRKPISAGPDKRPRQQRFSPARVAAILVKELIQLKRDRLTFAFVIGFPLIQLVLFGFAINTDPKALPTVAVVGEQSVFSRSIIAAMENSEYFNFVDDVASDAVADRMLARGEVLFVLQFPPNFARDLVRGDRPELLLAIDSTDPVAASNALSAMTRLNLTALTHDLIGPLADRAARPPPFELKFHRRYNPERITQYNIVPGLLGVVLTMTMVLMTGLSLTREYERGTMESLLARPVRPIEMMTGKMLPYIAIGYLQVLLVMAVARYVFDVPILGSLWLLSATMLIFIAANLSIGFTFSTLARTQGQAMQMTFFFFLPSILLSGFMFPFHGMPGWAQWIGEVLPLTHFLRIVRGILLKGNGPVDIWIDVWPLIAFMVFAVALALSRYRQTLD